MLNRLADWWRTLTRCGRPASLRSSLHQSFSPDGPDRPGVEIDPTATVAGDVRIWPGSAILARSWIGAGTSIGRFVVVGPDATVGAGCRVQNHVSVQPGVTLEDGVFCGPFVVFTNVRFPRAHVSRRDKFESTRVGQGATLGAGCVIRCGVSIGRYALVGAGAVVTRDVPEHALTLGNPARVVGWACVCGHRLAGPDADLNCPECGARYWRSVDGLLRY